MKTTNMAGKPHFRLTRPDSDSPTGIYLDLRHKGDRMRWGTGRSIHPELWDSDRQRPTTNRHYIRKHGRDTPSLKTDLENLKVDIDNIALSVSQYKQLQSGQGNPFTLSGLKEYLTEKYTTGDAEQLQTQDQGYLLDYLSRYVEEMQNGERTTPQGNRYAERTIEGYSQFLSTMERYEEDTRQRIRLKDIDMNFYKQFVKHYQDKNLSQNYIGRLIKQLKVLLRRSYREGIHDNEIFNNPDFRKIQVEVDTIYLKEEEIEMLREMDLSEKPLLERARDVFLVGCYTAMRYSDYSRIKPENVKENGDGNLIIELKTRKTGRWVHVPVRPELKEILDKYAGEIPKTHKQQVNRQIKEVAKLAGIDEQISIEEYRGGEKVNKTVPKYTQITTHTARRTGATLMYKAGIPTLDIMKITGHKTERNFLKYIRITEEEAAQRMAKHPYFTGK